MWNAFSLRRTWAFALMPTAQLQQLRCEKDGRRVPSFAKTYMQLATHVHVHWQSLGEVVCNLLDVLIMALARGVGAAARHSEGRIQ